MIIALASQFHVYLPWGQCPFSPSRGLLHVKTDCETDGSFYSTKQDGTLVEPTRLTDTYGHCPGKFQTKIDNEKKCGGGNFFR